MKSRFATIQDVPLLARMNRELVEDEGHRNRFHVDAWFEDRMSGFLNENYRAVLFEREGRIVAYALYTDKTEHTDTIYLRQIFIERSCRRQGIGREAMRILMEEIWPAEKRITVGVLQGNQTAIDFYRAIGFQPYSIEMEFPAPASPASRGQARGRAQGQPAPALLRPFRAQDRRRAGRGPGKRTKGSPDGGADYRRSLRPKASCLAWMEY